MAVWLIHRLGWIVFRPILSFFTDLTILGGEYVKRDKSPFIFISNHENHFDAALISAAMPFLAPIIPIRFFTRDIFFKQFLLKYILMFVGAFPGRIGAGANVAAKEPLAHLETGRSIGIFPDWCFPDEPDISQMQSIGPYISQRSGRPIIPVFLYGIQNLHWGKIFTGRKKIIVSFAKPVLSEPEESLEVFTLRVQKGLAEAKRECLANLEQESAQFWASYAKFYKYLELAAPYQNMKSTILTLLPEKVSGRWLDVGTGSGAMADLLLSRQKGLEEIIATDFSADMLAIAEERFRGNPIVRIAPLNLSNTHPFSANFFDGIVANLVLPYVLHHNGFIGINALRYVLLELHRVLKPGGTLVWSTPKRGVNFIFVAISSWRSFFDRDHPEYRYYAFQILRHALRIQNWGKREIYNFFLPQELEKILHGVGFTDISLESSLAGQVYVIRCKKP